MPTARSQIGSDFEKRKAKLGKGKQSAANATNTSFKARSIALPQQSISREKSREPVTRRHLSVDDLLGQLRHPNANVRKDALGGLYEIHQTHPSLYSTSSGHIVSHVIRLISDQDEGVRKALLRFLAPFLTSVSRTRLEPYVPLIVLHVGSAMSHIFPDVRIDAVKAIDMCLDVFGEAITAGWEGFQAPSGIADGPDCEQGARILRCFLTLLGVSTSSNAADASRQASIVSIDMPKGALVTILSALHRFLSRALHLQERQRDVDPSGCPIWMFETAFRHEADRNAFATSMSSKRQSIDTFTAEHVDGAWYSASAMTNVPLSTSRIGESFVYGRDLTVDRQALRTKGNSQGLRQNEAAEGEKQLRLFDLLSPTLLTSYLDAAATVFDPHRVSSSQGQRDVSARLVSVVISISLTLWRGVRKASKAQCSALAKLVARIAPYFPLGEGQHSVMAMPGQGEEVNEAWIDDNLSYCELVSLLHCHRPSSQGKGPEQMDAVAQYVGATLGQARRRSMLRGERFAALLPTVWLLLRQGDETAGTVVKALILHWKALATDEPTKRTSTAFLARLMQLNHYSSYHEHFQMLAFGTSYRSEVVRWITESLPRYLWELNIKDAKASETALEVLRWSACLCGKDRSDALQKPELDAAQKPLAPFFQVHHPRHGRIEGPYERLPAHVQRRARGVLSYLDVDACLDIPARAVGAL